MNQKQSVYGVIYLVTNIISGKYYVGQTTKSINERFKTHLSHAKNSKDNCKNYFYRTLKKYGKENFKIEKLLDCYSRPQLNAAEQYYIQYVYNSWSQDCGYNSTGGGTDNIVMMGHKHTEIAKQKISETRLKLKDKISGIPQSAEAKKKVMDWYKNLSEEDKLKIHINKVNGQKNRKGKRGGWNHSEEHKQKMSELCKGRIVSEETKKRMSDSQNGKKLSDETKEKMRQVKLGKSLSDETRRKQSEARKGKKFGTYPKSHLKEDYKK